MKNKKLIGLLLMLLCAAMLLSGCGEKTHELTYHAGSGTYYNSKTDVTYQRAELYYEAVGLKKSMPVAHIPAKQGDDIVLYQIEGAEPEKMLANEYFEIFYATGTTMPALWEMGVNEIHVGLAVSGAVMDMTVVTIENADDISSIISTYQNGPCFDEKNRYEEGTRNATYRLRFGSAQYPAIFYRLSYYAYAEDVLIYEVIDSKENFVPTYSGVSYTFNEDYVDRGELYAVYNFGKNLMYDHVTGYYYAVNDTIAKHIPADS